MAVEKKKNTLHPHALIFIIFEYPPFSGRSVYKLMWRCLSHISTVPH